MLENIFCGYNAALLYISLFTYIASTFCTSKVLSLTISCLILAHWYPYGISLISLGCLFGIIFSYKNGDMLEELKDELFGSTKYKSITLEGNDSLLFILNKNVSDDAESVTMKIG